MFDLSFLNYVGLKNNCIRGGRRRHHTQRRRRKPDRGDYARRRRRRGGDSVRTSRNFFAKSKDTIIIDRDNDFEKSFISVGKVTLRVD